MVQKQEVAYVLDTDPWYDPDDIFALRFLLEEPNFDLDLIVTGDELGTKRAQITTQYLKIMGRPEIPVVAGETITTPGHKTRLFCEDILPSSVPNISTNYLDAIASIAQRADKVVYMGIQGFLNLHRFQEVYPELAEKIELYQMAGAIDLPPFTSEHNVRVHIPAARSVLSSGIDTKLVLLNTTIHPREKPVLKVDFDSPLYQMLARSEHKADQILARHCREFKDATGYFTHMHDPITVAQAVGHSFLGFDKRSVHMDEKGVLRYDDSSQGYSIHVSRTSSRAQEFMLLLQRRLHLD